MEWMDRVYGSARIEDRRILDLIACPTFERLKGIRQAGPSALAFPFKTVTRYEHSLGVYCLLDRLGAGFTECVAGLLHDISHTAFSHATDFLFTSEEQDFHEKLKPEFLERADIAAALARIGLEPEAFYDDSIYPLLERPLPELCADRLDYFFRDSLACGVSTPAQIARFLDHLVVVDRTIAFDEIATARAAVELFAVMNRDWWAGPTEAFIYNEFADVLKLALTHRIISRADLLGDDAAILNRLEGSGCAAIARGLDRIVRFDPARLIGYVPKVQPKMRRLDPAVVFAGELLRLSAIDGRSPRAVTNHRVLEPQ